MSRKPTVARHVVADRESIKRAIGPFFALLYSPVSNITIYEAVLRFSSDQVITSSQLTRIIRKMRNVQGPVLVAAKDLTVEARAVAAAAHWQVITEREFGWTDESYARIKQH
jgi:hypothetical protein